MKKLYIFLIFLCALETLNAQTYLIDNTGVPVSTCAGTFYDTGGSTTNYSNSETNTMTFCSSTPGDQIKFNFTTFNTQASLDILTVYDGNSTSAAVLGTYSGNLTAFSVMSTSGCLTFKFTSNGTTVRAGWVAAISCITLDPSICAGAGPFCSGLPITYPASTNANSEFPSGVAGCGTFDNPAYYYLKIGTPGNVVIHIVSQNNAGVGQDVDFICWGPFANPTTNCIAGLDADFYSSMQTPHTAPPAGTNIVDCNFSIDYTEDCYINNALAGQYYLLCIANYANVASNITFNQTNTGTGAGATDCSIVIPCDISALTTTPSACDVANNQYSVSGTATFTDPPATGTLTVSDGSGHTQTFNAPFTSPQAYTLSGLTSDGASHNITATFSATTCSKTTAFTAPASCITCSAEAGNAGTISCTQNTSGIVIGSANNPANTYLWSPTAGLSSSTVSNPTANPTVTTTYTVTTTVTATGCTATDNVIITVDKAIPVSEAGAAGSITCTQNLSGITIGTANNASNTYLWNPTTDLTNSTISNPIASPTITTTYTVTTTTTSNGCSSIDNVVITVDKLIPTSDAGTAGSITCVQNASGLTIGAINNPSNTYSWSPTNNLTSSVISNPVASPTITTTYTVTTTTSSNGCSSSDEIIVTVDKLIPTAEAGSAGTITCTQNTSGITIGTTNNASDTYLWSPTTDLSGSSISNPIANPTITTTYTVTTTTTSNGCSSVDNVIVTVDKLIPTSEAGTDGSITCVQNLSGVTIGTTNNVAYNYLWSPINDLSGSAISNPIATPTTTTTYTVTTTSTINGCSSADNIVITVDNALPTANAGNDGTISCSQNTSGLAIGAANMVAHSYLWSPSVGLSSSTLSNPIANPTITTTYVVTITANANGCSASDDVIVDVDKVFPTADAGADGTITCTQNLSGLNIGVANNVNYTYQWSPTYGLSGTIISNPIATPSITTTYIVTTTNTASMCTAIDNVVVTVNNTIPTANAGSDKTITCSVPAIVLDGTLSESGATINYSWSGTIVSGGTTNSPTVNLNGNYVLSVTNSLNGCSSTDDVNVSLNTTPPVINASADVTICEGNSTNLTATGGVTYSWNPTIGLNNSIIANPIANPSATTTYVVTGLGTNGCTGTSDVVVQINPVPIISLSPASASICKGSSQIINALSSISGTTYIWTGLPASNTITVNPSTSTTYYVTGTASNCSNSSSVVVTVNPAPVVELGPDVSICPGNTTTLNSGSSSYVYHWSTNEVSPTISVSDTGKYIVTVSSQYCSGVLDSINVFYLSIPQINLGPNYTGCIVDVNLGVSDVFANYLWSTGETTPHIIVNSSNTYSLVVEDFNGCESSDAIVLVDSCFTDMFIPNCFTPNKDGTNDVFRVNAKNVKSFQMFIFNRWGQKVYETSDIEAGWDGRIDGNICPIGVYYYIIDYKNYHGVKNQRTGSVTIVK